MLRWFQQYPIIDHLKERVVRRYSQVDDRLRRVFVVVWIVRTFQEMSADDATHMAAGVAYYTLFSLFPLLLGLVAILSLIVGSDTLKESLQSFSVSYLPGSEAFVTDNLDGLTGALGIVAILGMLWSGSAIFGAVTRAVNRAWDVHKDRPFFISKPRQLLMALGTGILFFLSLASASFVRLADRLESLDIGWIQAMSQYAGLIAIQVTSLVLSLCIFLFIYKFLPNTKTYWKYIWPGAVVAAVLFELAKNLFITYLNQFANFENVYGSLAPVIVLLLWAYMSSLILIFGAELSSEYGRLKNGVDRGVLLHPRPPRQKPNSATDGVPESDTVRTG